MTLSSHFPSCWSRHWHGTLVSL